MKASVSVLLPYRDSEQTIEECIQSVQAQKLKDWELLAVNDHSSDESESIVRDYANKDGRIKMLRSRERGIVSALNRGISHASSPLIARMDADDRMLPDRLRAQVDFMGKNPLTGLVSCKVEYFSTSQDDTRGYEKYVDWTNKMLSHHEISLNRFVESPFAHPSVLLRKNLFDKFGSYREGDFPEDYELWLRFLSCGVTMNKINEVLLQWRDQSTRLSRQCSRYSQSAFQRTKARYLASWLTDHTRRGLPLAAWGAGKVAKKQAYYLSREGVRIERFFEVDANKIGMPRPDLQVSSFMDIPEPGRLFLLVLAGARSAREKITRFLEDRKYKCGKDYLFLA